MDLLMDHVSKTASQGDTIDGIFADRKSPVDLLMDHVSRTAIQGDTIDGIFADRKSPVDLLMEHVSMRKAVSCTFPRDNVL